MKTKSVQSKSEEHNPEKGSIKIYLSGKFMPKEEAKISVFDHGLLYGDGVFEGIRAYNGKVFRLYEHTDRLYRSAHAINLNIPLSPKQMCNAVLETLKINGFRDAYIRLVVTRGEGDLGLDPRKCPKPTIIIIADKIALYPEKCYTHGLEVASVSTRRNIPQAINPNIKSLNYLNNILAKIEANLIGVPEAIMLNHQGFVAECTGDNIFIIKDNELITPPTYIGALDGITRNCVKEIAKNTLNMEVTEKLICTFDLYTANEVFLTGTAAEVIPVVKVDSRTIGKGLPGEITKKLISKFRELTQTEGVEIY